MSAGKPLLSARSWQWPIDSGKRRDFCRKRESQISISHLSMWMSVRILGLCSYISNLMIKHVHFLPCICKCQVSQWPWHTNTWLFFLSCQLYIESTLWNCRESKEDLLCPPHYHTQEGSGKLEGKRDWDACRKKNKLGLHYLAVIIVYSLYLWLFIYLQQFIDRCLSSFGKYFLGTFVNLALFGCNK